MTVTGKKYQNLNHLNLTIRLFNHFIISQIEELAKPHRRPRKTLNTVNQRQVGRRHPAKHVSTEAVLSVGPPTASTVESASGSLAQRRGC